MDLLGDFQLYWALVELAGENQRITAEAKKAIEDITAEANGALRELAGIWRVHCNGLQDQLGEAQDERNEANAARDAAQTNLDDAIEELVEVQAERDADRRQLQNIRTSLEQLQRAVHPLKLPGFAPGGLIGGYSVAYGNPHRAIVSGGGWDSIYDGRG